MKVTVTIDDEPQEVDVSFDGITLQQSVIIEDVLGPDGYDRWVAEAEEGAERIRPKVMQALLFAKLKGRFPDLQPTDFDIDMNVESESDSGNGSGS